MGEPSILHPQGAAKKARRGKAKKGGAPHPTAPTQDGPDGAQGEHAGKPLDCSAKETGDDQMPTSIITIDPSLLAVAGLSTAGSRHALADSTVLHTCSSHHMVNEVGLLLEGSFERSPGNEFVDLGGDKAPIMGRGRRLMKGVFNGGQSLILVDVLVVEDLQVNIVSASRLRDNAGIWFDGWDCTLRHGPVDRSVVFKELERAFGLLFLEYKPRSHCVSFPRECVPASATGAVMMEAARDGARGEHQIRAPETRYLAHNRRSRQSLVAPDGAKPQQRPSLC
jgi:hypothetical protein